MLFNYVTVIPNCIPKELIDVFLSLRNREKTAATIEYPDGQRPNLDYRITDCIELPAEIQQKTIQSIYRLYNDNLIHIYKQKVRHIEKPQLLYYKVGGKYDVHNDCESWINGNLKQVCDRDVSVLVYLNDDYEGGELEFPDWGCTFKPKAGTVIAFPSYIEFSHRVHPVTKGERFSLVSWIATEDRIYKRPYT
jgi:predicted 2-oxoglutarate/Fe(II)-dependent dioxygenase YbiX